MEQDALQDTVGTVDKVDMTDEEWEQSAGKIWPRQSLELQAEPESEPLAPSGAAPPEVAPSAPSAPAPGATSYNISNTIVEIVRQLLHLQDDPCPQLYRSPQDTRHVYWEKGAQWYRIRTTELHGLGPAYEAFPDREGITLEPIDDKFEQLYCPTTKARRHAIVQLAKLLQSELSLAELEQLVPELVALRNTRARTRSKAMRTLKVNKANVRRRFVENWSLDVPPGVTPTAQANQVAAAAERSTALALLTLPHPAS